jgi:hypothetical protein
MLRSVLRAVRGLMGWPDIVVPTNSFVAVAVHTSYWDVLINALYCYEANIVMALNPKVYALWPALFHFLHFVPSKPLEERGTGGVEFLCEGIRKFKGPVVFFISPKGTIKLREWRSGYKYIAMNLQWPVRTALVDFSRRSFSFGPEHQHDEPKLDERLREELSSFCPLVPDNSEVPIKVGYDPFELLSIPDVVCLTNLCLVPGVLRAFQIGEVALGLISLSSVYVSWLYHASRESKHSDIDSSLAALTIVWGLSRMRHITMPFLVNASLAALFYKLGAPRHACNHRGPYVVYHSLFHFFVGLASWQTMN